MNKQHKLTGEFLNNNAEWVTCLIHIIGCSILGTLHNLVMPWLYGPQNWSSPPSLGRVIAIIAVGAVFFLYARAVARLLRRSRRG